MEWPDYGWYQDGRARSRRQPPQQGYGYRPAYNNRTLYRQDDNGMILPADTGPITADAGYDRPYYAANPLAAYALPPTLPRPVRSGITGSQDVYSRYAPGRPDSFDGYRYNRPRDSLPVVRERTRSSRIYHSPDVPPGDISSSVTSHADSSEEVAEPESPIPSRVSTSIPSAEDGEVRRHELAGSVEERPQFASNVRFGMRSAAAPAKTVPRPETPESNKRRNRPSPLSKPHPFVVTSFDIVRSELIGDIDDEGDVRAQISTRHRGTDPQTADAGLFRWM
ncbi:MAG: hypothetical protein Q9201_000016 [Fulgogasparrea decipioides]